MCYCGISSDCGIPHGAMSWSAVCERGISSDCGISLVAP